MLERLSKEDQILANGISVERKGLTSNAFVDTHWHDFVEIEYILAGHGKNIIDGTEYELKQNTLFFCSPVNFHRMEFDDETVLINITLSENICDPSALYLLISAKNENAVVFSEADSIFVKNLIFELAAAVEERDKDYYSLLVNALLIKTVKHLQKKRIPSLNYVQAAMLYILNNFQNRITLTDTADYVGLSPAYLSALFSRDTGSTFKEYLNTMRFEHAKKLLQYSELSISEICTECGFEDYANFLRGFKAHTGISPGRYRKEQEGV